MRACDFRLQMFRLFSLHPLLSFSLPFTPPPPPPPPFLSLLLSCAPSRGACTRIPARCQSLRCHARRRVLPPVGENHALAAARCWNAPTERAFQRTHLWICAAKMPSMTKPLVFLLCLLATGECRRHGHRVRRWTGTVESQNHGT